MFRWRWPPLRRGFSCAGAPLDLTSLEELERRVRGYYRRRSDPATGLSRTKVLSRNLTEVCGRCRQGVYNRLIPKHIQQPVQIVLIGKSEREAFSERPRGERR